MQILSRALAGMLVLFLAVTARAQTNVTLFTEDFEGAFPGAWTVGDRNADYGISHWGDVGYTFGGVGTASGMWKGYCAATNSVDNRPGYGGTPLNPTYAKGMASFMQRTVDLTDYYTASLTFKSYVKSLNPGLDFCRVFVNDTVVWQQSSADSGWISSTNISLDAYVGKNNVTIRFSFASDNATPRMGWFLDDIVLTASRSTTADLAIENLAMQNPYLARNGNPSDMQFSVVLSRKSTSLRAQPATVTYFLSPSGLPNDAQNVAIGTNTLALTMAAGGSTTVTLDGSQLAQLTAPATFFSSPTNYILAHIQLNGGILNDPNDANNWTAIPVTVDDYADDFAGATAIAVNRDVSGRIGSDNDVDAFRFTVRAGYEYLLDVQFNSLEEGLLDFFDTNQVWLASAADDWGDGRTATYEFDPASQATVSVITNVTAATIDTVYTNTVTETRSVTFTNVIAIDTNLSLTVTNTLTFTNSFTIVYTNHTSGFTTNFTSVTNGAIGTYYLKMSGAHGCTGAYTLHVYEVPATAIGSSADVAAQSATLDLGLGNTCGKHPRGLRYEVYNDGPAFSNGVYSVEVWLSDPHVPLGHYLVPLTLDDGQTLTVNATQAQLAGLTVPDDLAQADYDVFLRILPVLGPDDPDTSDNTVTGNTLAAPCSLVVVSGRVTAAKATGPVCGGIAIVLSGDGGTFTNRTLSNGTYAQEVPYGWSGTICAVDATAGGFLPLSIACNALLADQSGQNFVRLAPCTIAGRVVQSGNNAAVAGATLTFRGAGAFAGITNSLISDGSGSYVKTLPCGWYGTVTATVGSGHFAQPMLTYQNLAGSKTGQNFIWTPPPTISGRVTVKGSATGVPNVTVSASNGGGSFATGVNGAWTVTVPYGWTGVVSVALAGGGTFTPPNKPYASAVKANVAGVAFTWTAPAAHIVHGSAWTSIGSGAMTTVGAAVAREASVATSATTPLLRTAGTARWRGQDADRVRAAAQVLTLSLAEGQPAIVLPEPAVAPSDRSVTVLTTDAWKTLAAGAGADVGLVQNADGTLVPVALLPGVSLSGVATLENDGSEVVLTWDLTLAR